MTTASETFKLETSPEDGLAPLEITLFGVMQVKVEGRPPRRPRTQKALWLLALLALRSGRPVERSWLAGTLWPDASQEGAFNNLRPALNELRRVLGNQASRLQSPGRRTLRLDLADAAVDVLAFDAAVTDGRLPSLARAVSLYRGPLLEGCDEEWAGQERTAREQDCLRALGALADAALAVGDWGAAADHARLAVALDPWRDGPRRSLMEALARGGDVNAALHVYREFVALLREDPQAAPDEQTTALYGRLRAEARRVARGQASRTEADNSALAEPAVSGYLPHPLTDLVGREDERLEAAALLRRSRLVTLTGPGGIGKTRLAVAVADEVAGEYPGGVWLVALEALSDGQLIAGQITGTLGLREEAGRTPLEGLTASLHTKHCLLVLDNCEHLLDDCARVTKCLLRECAGVRVLATSREALGITGEAAWAVPGLSAPDPAHLPAARVTLVRVLMGYESVQLFVARARAVSKGFALDGENAAAAAQICARLEGLPLAVELAAARTRALTVAQIAARLEDHLHLLVGTDRTGAQRHQTLRGTLDWSYALLSMEEQLLLARLSVFSGGWTLEAAEAVCSGQGIETGRVQDLLTGLVDKSLVMFDGASGRYRLLEMVQQYAAGHLVPAASAQTRLRHRNWFLALAEEAEPHLKGPAQVAWLQRLDAENDNFRAALAWDGDQGAEPALRLAGALWWFWNVRGRFGEGRRHLAAALERAGTHTEPGPRAKALTGAGALAHNQRDNAVAQAFHEESLVLFRRARDRGGIASTLNHLGNAAEDASDHATATARYRESLEVYRELGDRYGIAVVLQNLGRAARQQGDYHAAQALYEESLEIRRGLGDRRGIAQMLASLGNVARMQGDDLTARALLEESASICRELGDRPSLAFALSHLGKSVLMLRDYAAARDLFEESLGIRRDLEDRMYVAWSLTNLGLTALYEGQLREARARLAEGLDLFRELGDRSGTAWALTCLGSIALKEGDATAARERYRQGLVLFRELGDKEGVGQSLRDLAGLCASQGQWERAVPLWGAAEALRDSQGARLPPPEREEYERQKAAARTALGDEALTASWGEGRALTWEQAVVYALEDVHPPAAER